ncbi:protein transport inhibitor response 1 [Diplodia corticola]|uniref:Protein transport inhibitor response 1 n=1 Tax=Diplodia corticola TaxID=236234 RepID=A0A1J9S4J3_9PEZI|nr:protein transport inhibitor response 1 [Diplodia corticola]OJD35455.1 protein transport inhibitor response 1 [Diplodia corticola]
MARHASPLLSLPAELQIKVVEELYEDPSCPYENPLAKDVFLEHIKSVRLTCKSLKAAAADTFLKTWFSHRSIVLERKSLLNFYHIATTSPFNRRIAQLDIAVYEFRSELVQSFTVFLARMEKEARDESCFLRHDRVKEHFLGDAERAADWPNARAAYSAYKKQVDDQARLYDHFAHIRLLARSLQAFDGLGSLRTISINGAQSPLTGAWTSGILQKCGISLLHKEKVALHSVTMGSVIRAMALSEVEPCTLVTAGLNASALQLSAPQRYRFGKIGFGHLHNLSLRLLDPKLFPSESGSALFRSGLLSRFIQQVQNLTNLSIEFYNQPYDVPLAKFLGRRIEKLESLSLGGLAYHAHDLVDWLTENGSKLEHLQLDYSSLVTGTWREVFRKMRSNLDLKSVYFHFLADDEESIHITGENVNSFILKKSTKVDWDTMESRKLPHTMGDLAGLFSVVVNSQPTQHHHHHHNHQHHQHHHHGQNGADNAPNGHGHSHDQAHGAPVVAGPAPPLGHPSTTQAETQDYSVASGTTSSPNDAPDSADGTPGGAGGPAGGTLPLPVPPPHMISAMQDLFQSALGVSLDFLDDFDDGEDDDLSDSFDDDDDNEEFNDEVSSIDSEPEDDEESDVVEEQDDDGYMTDDSVAEALVDEIISEL